MNCAETRRLLEADLDGELDLVRHLELRDHLRTCADCGRLAEAAAARRTTLQTALPRFGAPAGLADRIRASVRGESERPAEPMAAPRRRPGIILAFWPATGLAASIALALLAGYSWGARRAGESAVLQEVVTDHVRSLQVDHLMDVVSTDQHTVKPWFAGKTSFSPPVVDLARAGFPLAGGRLETIDGHTAVALVFHRRQHTINLFIWPQAIRKVAPGEFDQAGFHVVTWMENDLAYAAVSDIPPAEVAAFATEFKNATR